MTWSKGQYYRIVPHILRPWRHVTTVTNHWPQRCYIPPPLLQCKQTPAGDVWSHIAITYNVYFCSRDQRLTIGFLQQMWICVTANCMCISPIYFFAYSAGKSCTWCRTVCQICCGNVTRVDTTEVYQLMLIATGVLVTTLLPNVLSSRIPSTVIQLTPPRNCIVGDLGAHYFTHFWASNKRVPMSHDRPQVINWI